VERNGAGGSNGRRKYKGMMATATVTVMRIRSKGKRVHWE